MACARHHSHTTSLRSRKQVVKNRKSLRSFLRKSFANGAGAAAAGEEEQGVEGGADSVF